MKILIIGKGGREHALAWKLSQSPKVTKIFCAPGNPGTAGNIKTENVDIAETDIVMLRAFASTEVDLTIVGPEIPLINGIVDFFQEAGLKIFGPDKRAARIEGSKEYARQLMRDGQVPTAKSFETDNYEEALRHVRELGTVPCFVKADGPAAGKGAVPCQTIEEAERVLHEMMIDRKFGDSGKVVVIEEWLHGQEISAHAICGSNMAVVFPFARDHKRALDGDQGENTGGMGTVAPVPVSEFLRAQIKKESIVEILCQLDSDLAEFCGLLFPGIMLTDDGPKVLEYNARFGDPETEVFMRLLQSDLLNLLLGSVNDRLAETEVKWRDGFAVCVILASGGYPGSYETGKIITGIDEAECIASVKVFHCGTAMKNGKLVTAGGRVLAVTACSHTLRDALFLVYKAVDLIQFEGKHFRTDIGQSVLRDLEKAN